METKEEEKVLFSIEAQHELMSQIVSFTGIRFSICLSANIWTHDTDLDYMITRVCVLPKC